MHQLYPRPPQSGRRGVVLLVVLSLLTLFAVIGISFAFYASSEAKSSQLFREGEIEPAPNADPEHLMSLFLSQLIYDVRDDQTGVYSALRGHSLARSIYGWDGNTPSTNTVPYNGAGRQNVALPGTLYGAGGGIPESPYADGFNDRNLVNYTFFNDSAPLNVPRFPEKPFTIYGQNQTVGVNAPYTYPDVNNMFLAAVKADGSVLMPSFHRPWLFGPNDKPVFDNSGTLIGGNPNWVNKSGKYLTLRPRPADHARDSRGNPLFPYPEDAGGDVKNLLGGPGYSYKDPFTGSIVYANNDSYWVDLGAPVMTAPDGRKFKPLFAPLILDLDGRLNLNVHGNIRGGSAHASNQGWGPWEVNLGKVLNGGTSEWTQVFSGLTQGNPPSLRIPGRYDTNSNPGSQGPAASPPVPPPTWAPADFDGSATTAVALRQANDNNFSCFPTYPASGYENFGGGELANHPLLHNYFQPYNTDRIFPPSSMEALLRYGDAGSYYLSSEILRLMKQNLSGSNAKRRNMITTLSMDLDRPGVSPINQAPAPTTYAYDPMQEYFKGPALPFPNNPTTPPGGEFHPATWRSLIAGVGRVNLNRQLPPYPANGPSGRIDINNPDPMIAAALRQAYDTAQKARQELARDVFNRLRWSVLGDPNFLDYDVVANPPPPALKDALRWLAQVAVNVVDYTDGDDFITPFDWVKPSFVPTPTPGEYVFGTELPRLVLNEVYVEYQNDQNDPGITIPPVPAMKKATRPYPVKIWVELHNPLPNNPRPGDDGTARLYLPAAGTDPEVAIYELHVVKNGGLDPAIPPQENVRGEPDPDPMKKVLVIRSYTPEDTPSGTPPMPPPMPIVDPQIVRPAPANNNFRTQLNNPDPNGLAQNDGFYVLGPKDDFPGTAANSQFATLRVKDQSPPPPFGYDGRRNAMTYEESALGAPLNPHSFFLRRLACPGLPYDPNPLSPVYNPYITVDHMLNMPANDARRHKDNPGPNTDYKNPEERNSFGRRQPYVAFNPAQQMPTPPSPTAPQHTFFRHNAQVEAPPTPGTTLDTPFDWLVHLDRPLISPAELFMVSMYKPHELTHKFKALDPLSGMPEANRHRLGRALGDKDSRLFRALEFLSAGGRGRGVADGGRIPGKVNINTVWDGEIFEAIADPQTGNAFRNQVTVYDSTNPSSTSSLFHRLMRARDASYRLNESFNGTETPFRGLASGYPNGMDDSILRPSKQGQPPDPQFDDKPLFYVPPAAGSTSHPYLEAELMNKVFNHFTTRSNVFAVWVTVGFFEVKDDTTRPVKLGAEIGRSENRHVRHRMFAIVDRTNLTLDPPGANTTKLGPVFLKGRVLGNDPMIPGGTQIQLTDAALTGSYEGIPYNIRANVQMQIDVGPNAETVNVVNTSGGNFTVRLTRPHPTEVLINLISDPNPPTPRYYGQPGNPGPRDRYDPRQDPAVVRYLSVIQ